MRSDREVRRALELHPDTSQSLAGGERVVCGDGEQQRFGFERVCLNPVGLGPEREVDDREVKLSVGRSVDEGGDAVLARPRHDRCAESLQRAGGDQRHDPGVVRRRRGKRREVGMIRRELQIGALLCVIHAFAFNGATRGRTSRVNYWIQARARWPVPSPTRVVRLLVGGVRSSGKAQVRPVPSGQPQARGRPEDWAYCVDPR